MAKDKTRIHRLVAVSAMALCGTSLLPFGACVPTENGEPNDGSQMNDGDMMTDDGPAAEVTSAACAQIDEEGNEFETTVTATSVMGRNVTYTRRVSTFPEQDGSLLVETEILADGEPAITVVTTTDGAGGIRVEIEYGAIVPGLTFADIALEDGMLVGMINDRAIVPMSIDDADASALSFEDGAAPPDDDADSDFTDALAAVAAASDEMSAECGSAMSAAAEAGRIVGLQPRIPTQDTGHSSDPEATAGCVGCWAGCSTAAAGCIAGVSAGCVASLIFYAVCEVAGVAACTGAYIGCVAACNATGAPCCPVGCGEVACCEDGETCLNAQIGLCCDEGKTPCVGESCCSSTQTCIDTGPNAGICCQPEDICGNTCCDPGDSCIAAENLCCPSGQETCVDRCCDEGMECIDDGLCCDPQNSCGTACCDELDSCIESLNLCCGFDNPPCNDQCCDVGETCVAGTICCPEGQACGNTCCPDGNSCDTQTSQCVACPNPTDNPCVVGGCCPTGMVCTDFEGICCPQGETYCNGACRPISECIS